MSYCVLIPTINRKDLLSEALDWYMTNNPNVEVIVLDNGKQGIVSFHPNLIIYESETNKGVAGSWNWLIKKAIERGHTHFLVLNDDIVLQKKESLVYELIEKWGDNCFHRPSLFYHWSAFLLSKQIFDKVGEFDEAFVRCYFEDNDYEYRLRLADIWVRIEECLNSEVFRNSQSTERNQELNGFQENRQYYINKWGGLPNEETYKTPFNQ